MIAPIEYGEHFFAPLCCMRGTKYITGYTYQGYNPDTKGLSDKTSWQLDNSGYSPEYCPWCGAELPKEVPNAPSV